MLPHNLSISKVSPPSTMKVLFRDRLFTLLDDTLKYSATWVSAPAGFGKTTLVTSYLEVRNLRCLWYQIDQRDDDPATFYFYMGKAVTRIADGDRPIPMLTQEYLSNLKKYSKAFFENLFNCLIPPCAIVFDDFQFLTDESTTQTLIIEALRNVPEDIHVFIISRKDPCPAMAPLLASQRIACISKEEISLTKEETNAIIKLHDINGLGSDTACRLHQITRGWATGVILMLQQFKLEGASSVGEMDCPMDDILNYLALEIFQKLDFKIKQLLLRTAHFETFTLDMAKRLTQITDAETILSILYKENCFIGRRYQTGWIYQYHPLFKKFLRYQARQTFADEEIKEIKIMAAIILIDAGQYEYAASLCNQAKAWDQLVQLIYMSAQNLLDQGRYQVLIDWLEALPAELVESKPWLLYLMGVSTTPFDPVGARKWFESAYPGFIDQKNHEGLFLNWSCLVETYLHTRSSFLPLDDLIKVADEIVAKLSTFPSREAEYKFVTAIMSALVFRQPAHPQFSKWEQEAVRLFYETNAISEKVMLANLLVLHYVKMAELSKAAVIVSTTKQLLKTCKVSPLVQIIWYSILPLFLWVTGDFKASLKTVESGLNVSKTTGIDIWDPVLLGFGACASLSAGDLISADRYLNNMVKTLVSAGTYDSANYHYFAAWYAFRQDDLPLAMEHAKSGLAMSEESGDSFFIGRSHLGLAQIYFELNEPELALEHLDHAQKIVQMIGSDALHCRYLMIQAGYFRSSGNSEKGLVCLKTALTCARKKQLLFLDWIKPDVINRFCLWALEEGIEIEYVQKMIRKLNLFPDNPPATCESWPWSLRMYTLGKFSIVIDGKELTFKMKGNAKPLEMLKAIIASGANEVRKSRIEDILWPEADGDTANQSFTITLHRLRRMLGMKDAVILRKATVCLNHNCCWIDIWAFEKMLAQAETICAGVDTDDILLQNKAMDLYKGPFLADDTDYFWSHALRERLRSKYLRCAEKMGIHLYSRGDTDRAINCFRKALEVDPLAERIYKQLMLIFKQLGHTVDAVAVYQQCKKALESVPHILPSRETTAIYQSLLSG